MSSNRFFRLCLFVVLTVGTCCATTASAQMIRQQIRQQIRRALDIPPPGTPGHQVGRQAEAAQEQLLSEPLVQGDGRFLERAAKIVGTFAGADVAVDGKDAATGLKPVAVISLASFEDFKRVVQLVAQEIRLEKGSMEQPERLNAFLEIYGRIVGQGFDKNQPLGIVLQTDGILYYPLLFTPLDWDSRFAQNFRRQYADQLPDGRFVLRKEVFNWPLGRLYVHPHNGWLFIATETQLDALPDDPTVLLQGLDRAHLLAARFDLHNLPSLTTRAALSLSELQAVKQAETEIEKAAAKLGIGYIRSLAEQADLLEYIVSYDDEYSEYVVRQTEIVKPNTERARLLQERRDAQSPFHGFYHPEKAMLASHLNVKLTQIQREQLEVILDETLGKRLLTEEERQYLKQKPTDESKPTRRQRRLSEGTQTATDTPSMPPATEEDPSERLARLLARKPAETEMPAVKPTVELEPVLRSSSPSSSEKGGIEGGNPDRNLENVLRKIYVCYYWALIGAIRSGNFDGASTCSLEQGFLAAYNIVEGEKFLAAFNAVFDEYEKLFPEHFARNVRRDYVEIDGFRLTGVTLRPRDFVATTMWGKIVSSALADREMTMVFAVRKDVICFAVGLGAGQGDAPESRLLNAIAAMHSPASVSDLFFVFSPYEIGQAIALAGDPNQFTTLKRVAASGSPKAQAFASTSFTDTTKTITLRISALMTPSIWRLRENLRTQ